MNALIDLTLNVHISTCLRKSNNGAPRCVSKAPAVIWLSWGKPYAFNPSSEGLGLTFRFLTAISVGEVEYAVLSNASLGFNVELLTCAGVRVSDKGPSVFLAAPITSDVLLIAAPLARMAVV